MSWQYKTYIAPPPPPRQDKPFTFNKPFFVKFLFWRSDAKDNRHQRMLFQLCLEIRPPNPPPPALPPNSQVIIKMEIRTPPPPPDNKIENNSDQEINRRPDAKHNRHQRMLLQLCLEIRPPNPPPPPIPK